ncbi:MAG: copper chaperone PCu(A)C [Acidimicrobiia bacterium]|nr:copper chaperone PCu(A)C [Acidimicrobiia bacterium]
MHHIRSAALAVASILVLAACTTAGTACDDVDIDGAWFRVPPAPNGALYFEATNNGDAAIAITGASSDVANMIELHEVIDNDGMMQMQAIDGQRIEIRAGETVELRQGGLHVMAMGLADVLEDGDDAEFVLSTDAGCEIEVSAPITVEGE